MRTLNVQIWVLPVNWGPHFRSTCGPQTWSSNQTNNLYGIEFRLWSLMLFFCVLKLFSFDYNYFTTQQLLSLPFATNLFKI